jgi:hypothetical protein
MTGLPVIFGGAMIGPERAFKDAATIKELYDVLEKGGVKTIDSAQLYTGSEQLIGETDGASKFTIDTKWQGGFAGALNTKTIVESAKESMQLLKTGKGEWGVKVRMRRRDANNADSGYLLHPCTGHIRPAGGLAARRAGGVQERGVLAVRAVELPGR